MDNGPLVTEEIDAAREFVRRFNDYAPVKAAFWLRASGEDQRYLYLASDQIDGSNYVAACHEVARLANEMWSPHFDPFRIKVVYGNDPLALAAAEVNARYRGSMAIRLGGHQFGGLWIDDGYVYPTPLPAAADAAVVTGRAG